MSNHKKKIDFLSINLASLLIIIILLLQVKVFYVIPSSAFYSINGNQQQILMVLVLLLGLITLKLRPIIYEHKGIFGRSISAFLLYYVFELFYSSIKNGQGLAAAFISSNFYLMILFYYVLAYYFKKYGTKSFFNAVLVVSMLNILACWGQYILAKKGIAILHMPLEAVRFGSLRIYDMAETVTCFGIMLAYARFINSKSKTRWRFLILTILGVFGNLIVAKGRVTILAVAVGMAAITLVKFRKNIIKVSFAIILIILSIFVFFQTPVGKTYYDSLSAVETDTGSVRIREKDYYNDQTTSSISNFITGVGFIRDNGDAMSDYLKGPVHQYSRTDVGIFGLANTLGIIGVIWYILQIIKCVYYTIINRQRGSELLLCAVTGLLIFNIIYIPTMITFNPFSITVFTILLGLVQYQDEVEENNAIY